MDYWNSGIMGQAKIVFRFVIKPDIPSFHYSIWSASHDLFQLFHNPLHISRIH
jgi:hypothetical protein